MILPDFTRQTKLEFDYHVDQTQKSNNTNYDIILGKDIMQEFGIDILNSTLTLRWDGIEIPMRNFGDTRKPAQVRHAFLLDPDKQSRATNEMQSRVTRIIDAKYKKTDLKQLCNKQAHLSAHEQEMLHKLLLKYEHLFDGTLGEWKGTCVSFELRPDAKPFHPKPYPIAHVHEKPMRTECKRLVKLGVLEECCHIPRARTNKVHSTGT
jgi:hypothetical protein